MNKQLLKGLPELVRANVISGATAQQINHLLHGQAKRRSQHLILQTLRRE